MSKVDYGCYIDTTGMDDETRAKVERVFVDKFGIDGGALRDQTVLVFETKLFAGQPGNGCYYHDTVWGTEHPVTLEDVLAELDEDDEVHFDRNVVFLDYEAKPCNSAMEITITNSEEVTVMIGDTVCFDSVEKGKSKEECVDILKSWSNIINGAIKELEE